jgi:hypothetical protein
LHIKVSMADLSLQLQLTQKYLPKHIESSFKSYRVIDLLELYQFGTPTFQALLCYVEKDNITVTDMV